MSDPAALPSPESSIKNPILLRERRLALVQAAVEVFFAKGYHASRVADVAEAAGISQGTVYNYVKSKEDLLFMVCEDHLRGYERIVTAALQAARTPREKLDALLKGTVQAIFSYRKNYVVMLRELHLVQRERRRAFMKLAADQRKICEDILCEIAEEEGLNIGNSLLTSNLMIFLPSFLISRGWDLRDKVSEEEVASFLIDFMMRGLKGDQSVDLPANGAKPTLESAKTD